MRTGCKPLIMNTFHSDAENAMSIGTSSGTFLSTHLARRETKKQTKTKRDSYQQQERKDKEESTSSPKHQGTNHEKPIRDIAATTEGLEASQAPPPEKTPPNPVKGAAQETQVPSQPIATISSMTATLEPTEAEDGDVEMELDEQNLAGVDLEHLEHAYRHHKIFTIPPNQLRKVHKIFLNSSIGSTQI
jgi:flagellar biosynthesis GTPase FlhF